MLCFRSSVTFVIYPMWKSIGIVTDSSEYKEVSVAKEEDWKPGKTVTILHYTSVCPTNHANKTPVSYSTSGHAR